jgi:hypothetical protein
VGVEMRDTKGQVTIFVILGLVIAVGIIVVVILMGRVDFESPASLGPREIVSKCVEDAVEVSIGNVLSGGGEIVPSQSIMYQGEEWNYLCYQADYYQGCYNIHPMLESLIEGEIRADSMDEVQACFDAMAIDFENRGYDVSGGATSYSIDLLPGYVEIVLKKRVDVVKGDASQSFEDFDGRVVSAIYELVQIARDVVNSESQYCHFEYNGYMLLYPKYDIRRVDYSDSKIYRLIDRRSGEEFKFAVRSCAFAPGI